MSNNALTILQKHRLSHIYQLSVAKEFFQRRFVQGCSTAHCNATCCKQGVLVDVRERDNILAHKELVQRYMESHQEKNADKWFDPEETADSDFPSGRAVATQVRDYGCVFLDSAGRCVLQKAAMVEGMHQYALKPFFCVAYPITIDRGVLTVDDPDFANRTLCCSSVAQGPLTVFEVCKDELTFMLAEEGLQELRALAPLTESD